jgi:hypothetical protein
MNLDETSIWSPVAPTRGAYGAQPAYFARATPGQPVDQRAQGGGVRLTQAGVDSFGGGSVASK